MRDTEEETSTLALTLLITILTSFHYQADWSEPRSQWLRLSPPFFFASREIHSNFTDITPLVPSSGKEKMESAGYSPLKYSLIFVQILCAALFSGILFGWAPFQLIMINEGLYSCSNDESGSNGGDPNETTTQGGSSTPTDDDVCLSQQTNLNMLFTIATSTFTVSSLFIGMFVDHYGPTLTVIMNGIVVSSSLFLIGFSPVKDEGLFILIALLLGLGGGITLTGSFPIGFVVDQSHLPIVISAINCFFDASAVIFLFCYLIYVHLKISRLVIFLVFGLIAVGLYTLLAILWYFVEPEFIERKAVMLKCLPESSLTSPPEADEPSPPSSPSASYSPLNHDASTPAVSISSIYTKYWIHNIPTRLFIFISLYGAIQVLRVNSFFGTILQHLEYLGDDAHHYLYTQLFIAFLPLGFFCLPAIDYIFKKYGFVGSFHVLNFLSIAYSIVLLIPNLPIQVITFLLFVSARALMYSLVGTYIAHMFGPLNSGKMYGAFSWVSTLANVFQYPLFILVSRTAPGYMGLTYLNIFFLSLCVPLLWLCHHDLKLILNSYYDGDIIEATIIDGNEKVTIEVNEGVGEKREVMGGIIELNEGISRNQEKIQV